MRALHKASPPLSICFEKRISWRALPAQKNRAHELIKFKFRLDVKRKNRQNRAAAGGNSRSAACKSPRFVVSRQ
jgi:hypothetical protein